MIASQQHEIGQSRRGFAPATPISAGLSVLPCAASAIGLLILLTSP